MTRAKHSFKCIVAALLLNVGYSVPATAEGATMDDLFAQLAEADSDAHARIEKQIFDAWSKSGSAAMDLLLRRGKDAMEAGEFAAARAHFSALVDHAPGFAEGYYGRASASYFLGLTGPALDDLRKALALNPRHFEAMRGLGIIMEDLERSDDALEVYRMILVINPQSVEVQESVARLETLLEGQAL